jgi:hypothetical protein
MGMQDEVTRGSSPLHISEKGNFANAACACGWQGPARRSRRRARDDADEHERHCPARR